MRRSAFIIAIVIVLGFAAITVWKKTRNTVDAEMQDRSEFSAERKAEIRRFWQVYRDATNLKREGAWQGAAAAYREALAVDPRHMDALYYLGNVLFELNEYEEAVNTWRQLVEVNPLSTRAHIQLGAVHSCGIQGAPFDLDIAEQEFQRALAINKEQTGPIVKLGEVCLLDGRSDEALTYFTTAIQSNSKSVEAHYLIGYLEWQRGNRDTALEALRRAAELSRAKKPPAGVPLGEGDTRAAGGGPMLTEGASRRSFFAPHWMALQTWEHKEVSENQMEDEYKKLADQLNLLVGKGQVK